MISGGEKRMISFGTNDILLEFGTDIILSGISFSVNEGERLGIVGVNGAGKSSLMRIIAGLQKPTSGSVYTTYSGISNAASWSASASWR